MVIHDLKCNRCGTLRMDTPVDVPYLPVLCGCGGRFEIFWTKAPAVGGSWFRSGYNLQLGRSFETKGEHDAFVRSRGLEVMGEQDFKRTLDTSHEEPEFDRAGLHEAMEAAYHETFEQGIITPHTILDKQAVVTQDVEQKGVNDA